MSGREKRKRILICLSEDEKASEEEDDDDDDDDECSLSDSSEYGIDGVEEEDDDENWSDDNEDCDNDESLCDRIVRVLKEEGDIGALSLRECKAYLRKLGLRVSGTKAICIQRIQEHWRIKDGNGEALYPKSSFVINCTGDVCQGDVVLFTQKVYNKFNKVRRHGKCLGRRTVAGRVVHESYGAAKQQHTFTIEVLWTKGISKLPPLSPLLVKGRNLYRLKTFRQEWNNEAERLKVLDEKHKRGTVARYSRAVKRRKRSMSANGEHEKHSYPSRSSKMRKKTEPEKGKSTFGLGKTMPWRPGKDGNHHQGAPSTRHSNLKRNARSAESQFPQRYENFHYLNHPRVPNLQLYVPHNRSEIGHYRMNPPFYVSGHGMGCSSATTRFPNFMHYSVAVARPALPHQRLNYSNYDQLAHSNNTQEFVNVHRPPERLPYGTGASVQRRNGVSYAVSRRH